MKRIALVDVDAYHGHDAIFIHNDHILFDLNSTSPFMNFKEGLEKSQSVVLDIFLDQDVLCVDLQHPGECTTLGVSPAKVFLRQAPEHRIMPALRAVQWLTWHRQCRFCNQCGHGLDHVNHQLEKKCAACEMSFFPSLSPAIMVLITRGDEILLARGPHFPPALYAALAGFVDPGESAESAVHREVQEEVGLKVKSLKYFGSQSWPFPSSFMMAFTAEYSSGDIVVAPDEIEDAKWFHYNNVPTLPPMVSIARALIDGVISELKAR